jgi:2-(1,2-epoxy-1,2-dihydrophenyl)acetyl-CoA isomerase
MSDAPVLFERDGAVATIRLNRPDRLNAIDAGAAHQLLEACRRADREDGIRCLVLAGEGRAFLAGGDVTGFHEAGDGVQDLVHGLIGLLEESVQTLDGLRMPIVARVQGAVAGAGMSLMLAADVVVAADDTRLAFAYTAIGTTPDGGLSWSLPRAVGLRRATEIALLGEPIDAQEALRLGLVTKVVPRDELDAETAKVAGRLAAGPTQAFARTREMLRGSWRHTLPEQLALERESFVACAGTVDFREGVAAFVERRRADFRGR